MRIAEGKETFREKIRKLRVGKKPRIENGAISYVKKPLAQRSRYSIACALLALILAIVSVGISVYLNGEGGLNVGAWGFSSIVFTLAGFVYGLFSFAEHDTNTILSKTGIAICGVLIVFWVSMIAVGLMVK